MLLRGSPSLICKIVKYVGCKFRVCGKQLGCEIPQDGVCLALRVLVMATEVEDDNTIRSILHMLNDFGTDNTFALISACQCKLTWILSIERGYRRVNPLSSRLKTGLVANYSPAPGSPCSQKN